MTAVIAAPVYRVSVPFALLAVFAWVPAVQAGFLGQISPVALFLTTLAVAALATRHRIMAGLAIGLLFYKPPDALSFVVLLVVRREWRALSVSCVCAVVWYLASVVATAGDWWWPQTYFAILHPYFRADTLENALKTVSLPGLLLYAGASPAVAAAAGVTVLLACIPRLARASTLEAASFAPLIGLAASAHAYMYETALIVPTLLYVLTRVSEPARTPLSSRHMRLARAGCLRSGRASIPSQLS